MSFTLVRHKDGKETPIKVSILDAFRSTPPRRSKAAKPKKKPETKSSPTENATAQEPASDKTTDKDTKNANSHSDHEETYTAEENAKILSMKATPGTSWNDIKEAIGKRSVAQLKDHYKLHLGPNAEAEQKKLAEKIAKAEKNKTDGLAKQAEEGGKKSADESEKKAAAEGEEKAATEGGKKATEEGGKKGEAQQGKGGCARGGGGDGAIDAGTKDNEKERAKAKEERKVDKDASGSLTKQNLQNFMKTYERDKWLVAASRHYDRTGHRISPEAAKKMADQRLAKQAK